MPEMTRMPLKILTFWVIPFEETGALETFLLEAIAEQDEYDKEIINKGGVFVDSIDPEQRYLKKKTICYKSKIRCLFFC